jgi:hypothetical protein
MSIFRPKSGLRIGKIIKGLGHIIIDMSISDKVAKKCIEQGLGDLFDEIEDGEDPKPNGTSTGRTERRNRTNGATTEGGTSNGTTEGTANGGTTNGTTEGTANGGEETGSQSGAA